MSRFDQLLNRGPIWFYTIAAFSAVGFYGLLFLMMSMGSLFF